MFSAIIAWFWLKVETAPLLGVVMGLILGFSRGVCSSITRRSGASQVLWLPVIAALIASASYGYGSCFSRLSHAGLLVNYYRSRHAIFCGIIYAALWFYFFWPETSPSMLSWGSVLSLGIVSTAFSLIFFFRLLQQVGVANTVSVAYLIPIFGILWGLPLP